MNPRKRYRVKETPGGRPIKPEATEVSRCGTCGLSMPIPTQKQLLEYLDRMSEILRRSHCEPDGEVRDPQARKDLYYINHLKHRVKNPGDYAS